MNWKSKLSEPAAHEAQPRFQLNRDVPLKAKYDALVDEAMAGDAEAAMALAASLIHCLSAPRNEEQLAQKINYVTQTRRVAGYAVQVTDLDAATHEITRNYEYCAGIDKDRVLDHFVFIKIAADNGNIEAKVKFINYGGMDMADRRVAYRRVWDSDVEMYQDELRHLIDAANAGNSSAIFGVGYRLFHR